MQPGDQPIRIVLRHASSPGDAVRPLKPPPVELRQAVSIRPDLQSRLGSELPEGLVRQTHAQAQAQQLGQSRRPSFLNLPGLDDVLDRGLANALNLDELFGVQIQHC